MDLIKFELYCLCLLVAQAQAAAACRIFTNSSSFFLWEQAKRAKDLAGFDSGLGSFDIYLKGANFANFFVVPKENLAFRVNGETAAARVAATQCETTKLSSLTRCLLSETLARVPE